MHKQIYQKVIIHLSLLGVALSILVGYYDVIFGSLFEFCHTVYEIIEMGLDVLVEHTFGTNLRQTEIIVFYIMFSLSAVLIYLVWKALVDACSGTCQYLRDEWVEFKDAVIQDWQGMTMANRIIFVSVFLLVNYLASFLLF
jgi:hypothetical protein